MIFNMKKILSVFTVLIMLVSSSATCFGEFNDYVPSIAKREEVSIVGGEKTEFGTQIYIEREDGCRDLLICTPYVNVDSLEGESKRLMIEAYESIINSKYVTYLSRELKTLATSKGMPEDCLVVRDLFDLTIIEEHSESHYDDLHDTGVELTIKTQSLENFVCLLHYRGDNIWEIVKDVEIIDDTTLWFKVDSLSPFAIVVHDEYEPVSTQHCFIHFIIIAVALITVLLDFVFKKEEKQSYKNILLIINLIITTILFIFRECNLDIIAYIINIVLVFVGYFLIKEVGEEDDEE